MSNIKQLRKEIMDVVRKAPSKPAEVAERVSHDPGDTKKAREVIRTLVDKGDLQVTIDWKVRAAP